MKLNNDVSFFYPLLRSRPNEYKDSTINFIVNESTYNIKTFELQAYFIFEIYSKYMMDLIEQNKVGIFLKCFSEDTTNMEMRRIIFLKKNKYINIDGRKFFGKVKFSIILVALEDIENFESEEFYLNRSYKIEKNSIIGFSDESEVVISKEKIENITIDSIITIIHNENLKAKNITNSLESDKILINCPSKKIFNEIKQISNDVSFTPFLYEVIILPALTQAILNIDHEMYKDLKWNRILNIKLANLITENISYEKARLLATNLLDNPLEKTLENIITKEKDA